MTLPVFDEGDVLEIRGHRYEVDRVDYSMKLDRPFQYRLEPIDDAPPANLSTDYASETFAVSMHYEVDPDVVD